MIASRSNSLITFLRSVPVFGGLEGHSLENLIDLLEERVFKPGELVFSEGELGRTMYVVREGEVEVQRKSNAGRNVTIVKLGSGEAFGEMTLVELQPRSAAVTATRRTVTYSLTNMDLYHLYQQDNYAYVIILQNICRMLSRRLRKADGRIVEFLASGGKPASKAAKKPAKKKSKR